MANPIPIIGGSKPTEKPDEKPHRIVVIFPDDHSFDGVQFDVIGITPEQIGVAIMHLQRIAFMTLAQRDAVAQRAEQEAIAVQSQLARERGNH